LNPFGSPQTNPSLQPQAGGQSAASSLRNQGEALGEAMTGDMMSFIMKTRYYWDIGGGLNQ